MSIVPEDADLQMQWTRWSNRRNAAARDHLIVRYSPLVKFVAGRVGAGLPGSRQMLRSLLYSSMSRQSNVSLSNCWVTG